jgi:hypothetical protein
LRIENNVKEIHLFDEEYTTKRGKKKPKIKTEMNGKGLTVHAGLLPVLTENGGRGNSSSHVRKYLGELRSCDLCGGYSRRGEKRQPHKNRVDSQGES